MKLSAGVIDAGASSLATFLAALVAARTLTAAEMGAYALVFAAWTLATQVPSQLIYASAEAKLVSVDPGLRSAHLAANLRHSLPWSAVALLCVLGVMFLIPSDVPMTSAFNLSITGAVAAVLAPAQEHARQLLHLDGANWSAAWVSVARVILVGVGLASAVWWGVPVTLAPLGALAVADGLCLLAVVIMARPRGSVPVVYDARRLLEIGSWLLVSAMASPVAGFVVNLVLAQTVSSSSLGIADKARIAAQPILVLGVGLSAVLRAGSMRAALDLDRKVADTLNRRFQILMAASVAVVLLISITPTPFNVIEMVIPDAFVEPGLMQLSVLAAAANAWVMLRRHEVIALGDTRRVAVIEGWSSLARLPVALAARALQSWVVPAAFLAGGLVRAIGFARVPFRRPTAAG